ncbi:MAG: AMP-binding protein [Deltaproteobacteria bacterium]|nr:AMP-binding protein [Deltaproteobacteria bacterium]
MMSKTKEDRFFDELEGISPEERERYQSQKLREALESAYRNAPSAKEIFDRAGVSPSEIRTAKDLERLPITRKGDLIELEKSKPPYGGFLAIPLEEVERVFITPGPIYGPHYAEGISWFGKTLYAAGFRKGDIVINTPTYHMSPAGMLFHEGVRACGATVIPTGVGNTDAQIRTMLDLKVTGYAGMPSFLMTIIKRAEEMGHDFRRDFALKRAWFTGEILAPSIRKALEEDYGISTFQCYSVTDLGGCVAYECSEKSGMHFMDEYVIEIVDPDTGKQLPPGEVGEIVATPIHNNTWGLIRYGTGDMSLYITEPCPCGRTSYRLGGIVGRTADAVKIRGMFVIAKQAEQVFSEFDQISRYQLIVGRKGERDELVFKIELKDESIDKAQLSDSLAERFPQLCRVRPDRIEFVPQGTIPEERQTIADERKWK